VEWTVYDDLGLETACLEHLGNRRDCCAVAANMIPVTTRIYYGLSLSCRIINKFVHISFILLDHLVWFSPWIFCFDVVHVVLLVQSIYSNITRSVIYISGYPYPPRNCRDVRRMFLVAYTTLFEVARYRYFKVQI